VDIVIVTHTVASDKGELLKSGLMRIKSWFKQFGFTDILLLLGTASVFYGTYLIYKPASFILLGAGLIYWAITMERNNGRNNSKSGQ
jgi:hypothetical protein